MTRPNHYGSAMPILLLSLSLLVGRTRAQDTVDLHSVGVHTNGDVTVVYSKNFATCAHLRFSNAACTQLGALTHVQNHFCTQGNQVAVTLPATAFVAGFGIGVPVLLVHGNNPNVRSLCVPVACDGKYGAGCAGSFGTPLLDASNACPAAGGSLDLTLTNGPPFSVGVMGFALGQTSFPLFGCTLLLNNVLTTATLPLDGLGTAALSLPLPLGSSGLTFTVQTFVLDAGGPQGLSATNGVLAAVQ